MTDLLQAVSNAHISKSVDKAMDKVADKVETAPPGVSIRHGPVTEDKMDVDEPATNGHAKRKARSSTGKTVNYKVVGSDEESDDAPLVCEPPSYYVAILDNATGNSSVDNSC